MRSFWLGSVLSIAVGLALSVFMYIGFASSQAGNCRINDVACSELGAANVIAICAMPAAAFLFVVLLGIRIKRHSPRAATSLVVLVPVVLFAYAAIKASVMSLSG